MKKLYCVTGIAIVLALVFATVPSFAVGYCSTSCWGKPPTTQCACPPPYFPIVVTCGGYPVACDPMTPYLTGPSFLAPEPAESPMDAAPSAAPREDSEAVESDAASE